MIPDKILEIVYQNIYLYLFILIIYSFSVYIFIKKYIYSIFDPLFYAFTLSIFGGALVIFMYFNEIIDWKYFSNYMLTQIAFIIGFTILKPLKLDLLKNKPNNLKINKLSICKINILFYISSILYIASNLISYYVGGIPIMYESRLSFYFSDSGFGVFSRLIYGCFIISAYALMLRISLWKEVKQNTSKFVDISFLITIILFSILSGSKSSLLGLIFVAFYFSLFSIKVINSLVIYEYIKKMQYKLLFLAIIIAIFLSIYQVSANSEDQLSLYPMINRFILSGDVFVIAYPNGLIENMVWNNPLLIIFQDFLGTFRIISWDKFPATLGIELFRYLVPDAGTVGPNPRHNVFGYVYFGYYGSILFSFFIGCILAYFRTSFYRRMSNNYYSGLLFTLILIPISGIESDVGMVIGNIDSIIISMILVTTIALFCPKKNTIQPEL